MLWFHFSGATSSGASGAGTRHGTSLPPVGFWANQDGSSDSGAATPSGRFGTAEPPLGLWAYNSGAFDDRSSGSPTGQFGPPQPPIGFWAVVSGLGGVAVTPSPTVQVGEPSTLGGSKPHKKRRGPYSDPKIFEQYIKRCIAEREQPRVSVQAAVLKEALVHEVEERTETAYAERDALLRENQILEQLLAFETAKRDLQAIRARQRQIDRQLRDIESDEVSFLLAVFEEM